MYTYMHALRGPYLSSPVSKISVQVYHPVWPVESKQTGHAWEERATCSLPSLCSRRIHSESSSAAL